MLRSKHFAVVSLALLAAAASGAAWSEDLGLAAAPQANTSSFPEDPIVFVHGCPVPAPLGSGTNYVTSAYWRDLYEQFRAKGYPAEAWSDDRPVTERVIPRSRRNPDGTGTSSKPWHHQFLNILVQQSGQCGDLIEHAEELEDYVERVLRKTGADKVDIVANSLGALAARYYIEVLGGRNRVRDVALLAGTNHGTNVALAAEPFASASPSAEVNTATASFRDPNYAGARQTAPAYNCFLVDDGNSFQRELNGCTGQDDPVERFTAESPDNEGKVSWISLYNNVFDELHQPTQTSCLNQKFPNDCSDGWVNVPLQNDKGQPHGDYRLNEKVIEQTYTHITSRKRKIK